MVAVASAIPDGWLGTRGSAIVDSTGEPVVIKAVNWFGLETDTCAPHGLWSRSLDSILDQMASFGFNTIRLPYASQCLEPGARARSIDAAANPQLQALTPLEVMDAVVAGARERGMRVLLDRHRPGNAAQSELWYTDAFPESRWIADWVTLAQRYADDPTVIGGDLHNEPHGSACWSCGDPSRDWAAAATRAGDAILAVQPNWLIVIEGVELQDDATTTWWGGGLADAGKAPITLSVADRVVYSPHDYPASIFAQTWFAAPDYPANLTGVWDRNWGYLVKDGIAPVLVGEFGTKLQTDSDQQWLGALVDYLADNRISFAYWSFNPNSGDTGGLVADDWLSPQSAKLAALAPLLGPPPGPLPPGTTTPSSPAPSAPPTAAPPTSAPPTAGGGLSGGWTVSSTWAEGYVAQLTVTAGSARTGWKLSWPDAAATSIAGSWGMTCTVAGGSITCASSDWTNMLDAGQTVTVGVQVVTPAGAPANPPLTFS